MLVGRHTGLILSEKVKSFDSFKIAMSLSTEAELMSNFGCLWTAEARTKDEVALQWSCSPNITRNWDPPLRVIRSLFVARRNKNLVGKLILWVHFLSSNNPIRRRN